MDYDHERTTIHFGSFTFLTVLKLAEVVLK